MKGLTPTLLFIAVMLPATASFSQGLKKFPIGNSGCSLYSFCEMKFDESTSRDSSPVYTGECEKEEVTYGTICVKLLNPPADLTMAEDLLVAYLDHLKESFAITKAAGYGKGHRLNKNADTRGILDYWEDREKNNWKVKAWTDGKFIGVLYAFSKKELPEQRVNVFLEGFRMPAMK